jgi:hypothetical protein
MKKFKEDKEKYVKAWKKKLNSPALVRLVLLGD